MGVSFYYPPADLSYAAHISDGGQLPIAQAVL
jgi:hypothetical protein